MSYGISGSGIDIEKPINPYHLLLIALEEIITPEEMELLNIGEEEFKNPTAETLDRVKKQLLCAQEKTAVGKHVRH